MSGGEDRIDAWMVRMEKKLDDVRDEVASLRGQWAIRPCVDHERRLRIVEESRQKVAGVQSLIAAAPGVVALIALLMMFGGLGG